MTEDNVSERYAAEYCDQMERCELGNFEASWDDMTDCVTSVEDVVDDALDVADVFGCEFDSEAAGDTLHEMRTASCEDFSRRIWATELADFCES